MPDVVGSPVGGARKPQELRPRTPTSTIMLLRWSRCSPILTNTLIRSTGYTGRIIKGRAVRNLKKARPWRARDLAKE